MKNYEVTISSGPRSITFKGSRAEILKSVKDVRRKPESVETLLELYDSEDIYIEVWYGNNLLMLKGYGFYESYMNKNTSYKEDTKWFREFLDIFLDELERANDEYYENLMKGKL